MWLAGLASLRGDPPASAFHAWSFRQTALPSQRLGGTWGSELLFAHVRRKPFHHLLSGNHGILDTFLNMVDFSVSVPPVRTT